MQYLGFYLGGHDSNFSVYDSLTDKFSYFLLERVTGIKHDRCDIDRIKLFCKQKNIVPDKISYSSCKSLQPLSEEILFKRRNDFSFATESYYLDHHYAHALSCNPLIKNKNNVGYVVIDGRGDNNFSIRMFRSYNDNLKSIFASKCFSYGYFLQTVGGFAGIRGNKLDIPGKLMGLCAGGKLLAEIQYDDLFYNKLYDLVYLQYPRSFFSLTNQKFIDFLYTIQEYYSRSIITLLKKYFSTDEPILFSGGVAQNIILNTQIRCEFPNFTPIPHCTDGGLSIGLLWFLLNKDGLELKIPNYPYLVESNDQISDISDDVINYAVDLLANKNLIGWYQGNGEVGLRELGNRSILADPTIVDIKNIVNKCVKNREYWRPYAISILDDHLETYFGKNQSDPYMLFINQSAGELSHNLKEILHVDGSVRLQAVDKNTNPTFYKLISKFYEKTGIPFLLNTSLNCDGQPIFNNKKQCHEMINNKKLKYIFYGNEVLS